MTMNNTKDASVSFASPPYTVQHGRPAHVNTLRVNRLFDASSVAANGSQSLKSTLDNALLNTERTGIQGKDSQLNGHSLDGKRNGYDVQIDGEKGNVKPLKGILVHQGCRSQDGTPHNTPRFAVDAHQSSHRHSVPAAPISATLPPNSILAQKRNTSTSAVADFLKKFSPKLGRSKKSLQWYTVDIRPSAANGDSTQSVTDLENEDLTVKELQNGRISSEFVTELSECILHNKTPENTPENHSVPDCAPSVLSMPKGFHNIKDSIHIKHHRSSADHGDTSKTQSKDLPTLKEVPAVTKPVAAVTKPVVAAPAAQTHSPWRAVVVDIDIDKPSGSSVGKSGSSQSSERQQFFESMRTPQSGGSMAQPSSGTSSSLSHKHVEFRLPDHYFQNLPAYDANAEINRRVPSYIKLSRALNGYSARNMYTSKKLVNSRDYNVLLCKSEEYLNRRTTTPTPTPTLSFSATQEGSHSARSPYAQPLSKDFRRAASEDRDLSLVGRDDRSSGPVLFARQDSGKSKPKAGHEFLQKLDAEVVVLQKLCQQGQEDLQKDLPDEAADQLRSAVGKTTLLLTQKFEQFRQLCHKNIGEKETDALKTTVSDLQGFWDMVSLQISDVQRMFKEVERLKTRAPTPSLSAHHSSYQTPSSNGSDVPQNVPSGTFPDSVMKSPGTPGGGARRQSKPKVTFQLNERDVQRKEMIAAKRKAFEQEKRKDSLDNSSNAPLSLGSVAGGDGDTVENPERGTEDHDIQIFMPAATAPVN